MKLFLGFAIFIWLLCGFLGDWRLEGVHNMQWKHIVRGPITLIHAMREYPIDYSVPSN